MNWFDDSFLFIQAACRISSLHSYLVMDFTDRHFIITGGTGALGTAVIEELLETGAKCSIPCYDKNELEEFAYSDRESIYIQTSVDLTDEHATHNFYTMAAEQHGPLWGSFHLAVGFSFGII